MSAKYLFASDIHGDAECTEKLLEALKQEGADKLVLLGDILYHGPRNDLPFGYNPKKVISLLNPKKDNILAVRGNCDAEVDGMVLDFPIMAEYALVSLGEKNLFLTHGHRIGENNTESLPENCILVTGHTHVPAARLLPCGTVYLNPGSVSIPKDGSEKSYMVYEPEENIFRIKTLDGKAFLEYKI